MKTVCVLRAMLRLRGNDRCRPDASSDALQIYCGGGAWASLLGDGLEAAN